MSVEFERHGAVGVFVLADEARHNALTRALVGDLRRRVIASRAGPEAVRALVLTSRGPTFCAGGDIGDFLASGWLDDPRPTEDGTSPFDLFATLAEDPRPIVAAMPGRVIGGGVELASMCDLLVATPATSFAFPETGLGLVPAVALHVLPGRIGWKRTLDLVMTRRRASAEEALAIGLVDRVVPAERLLEEAIDLAARIVAGASSTALAAVKCARPAPDWQAVRAIVARTSAADRREGLAAFVERRPPMFEESEIG